MFELIILFNILIFISLCIIVKNDFKKFKEKVIERNNKIIRHLKSHASHMESINCEGDAREIEKLIIELKESIR